MPFEPTGYVYKTREHMDNMDAAYIGEHVRILRWEALARRQKWIGHSWRFCTSEARDIAAWKRLGTPS